MNVTSSEEHNCKKFRAYLDSYLNNELQTETSHDVIAHVENCPDCHQALENRRRAKELLKAAVMKDVAPAELRAKIRREIRKDSSIHLSRWMWAAAAAVVLIAATLGGLRVWRHAAETRADAVAEIAGAQILEIGLKDHVHCALDAGFANREFTEDQMRERLGPEYFGLVALVKERLNGNYTVTVGHRCKANGREYIHLVLKNSQTVLSLVFTKKDGESFAQNHVAAVLESSGVPVYGARMKDLEVAGFETGDYLAFVVSDLSRADNMQIASTLAPQVRDFFSHLNA